MTDLAPRPPRRPRPPFEPVTTAEDFEDRLKERLSRHCRTHRAALRIAVDKAVTAQYVRHAAHRDLLHAVIVAAEVKVAAAALGFIRPEHAVVLIEWDDVEVSAAGEVDHDLIDKRLTGFLATAPYHAHPSQLRVAR